MIKHFLNLRRFVFFLLLTGSVFPFFLSPAFSEKNPDEILAGVHRNFPPHYSLDEKTGLPAGFAIDIMDAVAKKAGLNVRYLVFDEWTPLIQALKKGDIDLIPNMGIIEERIKEIDFTNPIETYNITIFVRKTTTDIQNIDDLQGRKVAVVTDNKGLFIIQEYGKAKPVICKSLDEAFVALLSGNADALVYPEPPVLFMARKSNLRERIKIVGKPLFEVKRAIAVGKGKTELFTKLNQTLTAFIVTPEYKKIYAKWNGVPESRWNTQRVLTTIGMSIAFIIILSVVWHYLVLMRLNRKLENSLKKQQKAEGALRESEERYRKVFEDHAAVKLLIDPDSGNILEANEAAVNYYGWSCEQLKQMNVQEINMRPPEDIKREIENVRTKKRNHFEFRHRLADGSIRDVEVFSSKIEVKGKDLLHSIIHDISDRKRAEVEKRKLEEQLQRAEKMEALGTLAGGVAHDLNNVLGIIVGYSELLLYDVEASSPLRPGLESILGGSQRAAAIVQDLLTLARRGISGRQVLNLNKIIVDCRNSAEFENLFAYHPSLKIKTDLEPDLLNLSGSAVHLSKTLFNLASNASEAMPKGGALTIKTSNQYLDRPIQGYDEVREGDYVVLSVSDTGEGIPPADLKRIFEPFYTKKVMGRSGTGLGLAVVWGTVKDHHGYINVQSEEGKGSTFTLYFPVTREEITAEENAAPLSEYLGNGETILLVDDIKGQRDLAKEMLKKLNYNVTSASSGEEAVAYLKEHTVDLLVLDMIMDPGMDGLDTYQRILEIHPQQKAIIVSGFSETGRVHSAQALGAGAYVRKPYVMEKLGLAVRKELGHS